MMGRFACFIISTAFIQIKKIKGHYNDSVSREPYGVEVIRVTFNNWAEFDLCALLYIICMDSLHPAVPIGVRELRILCFDHPPRCPECVIRSEEWLVMSQRQRWGET